MLVLLLRRVSTDRKRGRIHIDLFGGDSKDLAGAGCDAGKELGRIVCGEPVQRAPQAIISEQVSRDPFAQQMLDRFLGNILRDQVPLAIAEPQPIEDHRCRRCSYADRVSDWSGLAHSASAARADLLTHSCHDSQVVQPLIHRALCCLHLAPSILLDLTLSHSPFPVNKLRNVG